MTKAKSKSGGKGKLLPIKELIAEGTIPSSTSVVETAGQTAAQLIEQPHGGALLPGGQPGNKGGGRTAAAIKGTAREILASKGLPWILKTLSEVGTTTCPSCGEPVQPLASDAIKAKLADTLFRAGVGTQQEIELTGGVTLTHDTVTPRDT